jgi:hypothetical protein
MQQHGVPLSNRRADGCERRSLENCGVRFPGDLAHPGTVSALVSTAWPRRYVHFQPCVVAHGVIAATVLCNAD